MSLTLKYDRTKLYKLNVSFVQRNNKRSIIHNLLFIAFSNTTRLVLQRICIKMAHFSEVLSLSLQICDAILEYKKKKNISVDIKDNKSSKEILQRLLSRAVFNDPPWPKTTEQ